MQIAAHGPPDVYQHTSIGAGLEASRDLYAASPISGDFDIRATVVFTDGFEDRQPWIADVQSILTERVYAVGVGDAANVRNDILWAVANNTGGFMLVTGRSLRTTSSCSRSSSSRCWRGLPTGTWSQIQAGYCFPGWWRVCLLPQSV
jgi:hypothetical protein